MGAHRDTFLFYVLTACCILSLTPQVRAGDAGRFTILKENSRSSIPTNTTREDSAFRTSARRLSRNAAGTMCSAWSAATPPSPQSGRDRRVAVFIGQSIFTPKNLSLRPPDPYDRPYAGWLYIGVSVLQETDLLMLENLELDAGIVGPGWLAKQVQNDFHQFIGIARAQGCGQPAPERAWNHVEL